MSWEISILQFYYKDDEKKFYHQLSDHNQNTTFYFNIFELDEIGNNYYNLVISYYGNSVFELYPNIEKILEQYQDYFVSIIPLTMPTQSLILKSFDIIWYITHESIHSSMFLSTKEILLYLKERL